MVGGVGGVSVSVLSRSSHPNNVRTTASGRQTVSSLLGGIVDHQLHHHTNNYGGGSSGSGNSGSGSGSGNGGKKVNATILVGGGGGGHGMHATAAAPMSHITAGDLAARRPVAPFSLSIGNSSSAASSLVSTPLRNPSSKGNTEIPALEPATPPPQPFYPSRLSVAATTTSSVVPSSMASSRSSIASRPPVREIVAIEESPPPRPTLPSRHQQPLSTSNVVANRSSLLAPPSVPNTFQIYPPSSSALTTATAASSSSSPMSHIAPSTMALPPSISTSPFVVASSLNLDHSNNNSRGNGATSTSMVTSRPNVVTTNVRRASVSSVAASTASVNGNNNNNGGADGGDEARRRAEQNKKAAQEKLLQKRQMQQQQQQQQGGQGAISVSSSSRDDRDGDIPMNRSSIRAPIATSVGIIRPPQPAPLAHTPHPNRVSPPVLAHVATSSVTTPSSFSSSSSSSSRAAAIAAVSRASVRTSSSSMNPLSAVPNSLPRPRKMAGTSSGPYNRPTPYDDAASSHVSSTGRGGGGRGRGIGSDNTNHSIRPINAVAMEQPRRPLASSNHNHASATSAHGLLQKGIIY
jgi:hypothetical protein